MQAIDIIIGRPMPIPLLARPVRAGFPSPADDFIEEEIDLQRLLITNRPATFLVRVAGDSMVGARLFDGDLAVVDRSLDPRDGDIVVVDVDGDRSFKVWGRRGARVTLAFANPPTRPSASRPTRSSRCGASSRAASARSAGRRGGEPGARPDRRQQLLLLVRAGVRPQAEARARHRAVEQRRLRHRPDGRGQGARHRHGRALVQDPRPVPARRRARVLVELRALRLHVGPGQRGLSALQPAGGDLLDRRELPGPRRRRAAAARRARARPARHRAALDGAADLRRDRADEDAGQARQPPREAAPRAPRRVRPVGRAGAGCLAGADAARRGVGHRPGVGHQAEGARLRDGGRRPRPRPAAGAARPDRGGRAHHPRTAGARLPRPRDGRGRPARAAR